MRSPLSVSAFGESSVPELSKSVPDPSLLDTEQAGCGHSPLLVTAKTAAMMCGKSLRTWRTWDAAGWIPRPIRIGRSTLWRVNELQAWVAAACPRRAEWEARS